MTAGAFQKCCTWIFDFLEMLPEPAKGFLPVGIAEFVLEFFESEVDNVNRRRPENNS